MKKICAIVLLFCFILQITACGKKESTAPESSSTASDTSASASGGTATDSSSQTVSDTASIASTAASVQTQTTVSNTKTNDAAKKAAEKAAAEKAAAEKAAAEKAAKEKELKDPIKNLKKDVPYVCYITDGRGNNEEYTNADLLVNTIQFSSTMFDNVFYMAYDCSFYNKTPSEDFKDMPPIHYNNTTYYMNDGLGDSAEYTLTHEKIIVNNMEFELQTNGTLKITNIQKNSSFDLLFRIGDIFKPQA